MTDTNATVNARSDAGIAGTKTGTEVCVSTDSAFAGSKVTVVVPVYGVEQYLDRCVASVVAQTYKNLEILLVDDGSPARCPQMCDAWAERDRRIRVIHQSNAGLSAARNRGLAQATGEYLYFVDSDDTIEPTLVEHALNAMSRYDADLCMFKFDTISDNDKPLLSNYKHNAFTEVQVLTPEEAIKKQLQMEIGGYAWAYLAPLSTYRKQDFAFPVGRKIEDLARICHVIGESTRIVRIPDALYHYRLRQGSITATLNPSLQLDWIKAADDRENYILSHYSQLKSFLKLQQLNFFANLDYESMRQSLITGLNIDPEEADALRRRIEGLKAEIDESGDEIPDSTTELLSVIKESVREAVDDFKDMRDDWRQIMASVKTAAEEASRDRESQRIEREIRRNGIVD